MAIVRSLLFYGFAALAALAHLPFMIFTRKNTDAAWSVSRSFLSMLAWAIKVFCGLHYRVEGLQNLPSGACLIASSQQSTWENLFFPLIFDNPAIWIKSELYRLPFTRWFAVANRHIRTERSGDTTAARAGFAASRQSIADGRSVLLFVEGTRNSVPGRTKLKSGARNLYRYLGAPCVPVALNSGRFWPYGSHVIRPGTVTVVVGEPIKPGFPKDAFSEALCAFLDETNVRLADRN